MIETKRTNKPGAGRPKLFDELAVRIVLRIPASAQSVFIKAAEKEGVKLQDYLRSKLGIQRA